MTSTLGPVFPIWPLDTDLNCTCAQGSSCSAPGKHPAITGWRQEASDNPAVTYAWSQEPRLSGCGWGLLTDDLCVVDVDDPDPYALLTSLNAELSAAGYAPIPTDTYSVRTGSGGLHLYFVTTEDLRAATSVGVRPNVDLKGQGGYVVTPGSRHRSGNTYQAVEPVAPIQQASAALLTSLSYLQATAPARQAGALSGGEGPDLSQLLSGERILRLGSRNDTLWRLCSRLRGQGIPLPEATARMRSVYGRMENPPDDHIPFQVVEEMLARAYHDLPTNADLDECHGRTSPVLLDGEVVTTYHYSATHEFPYFIGCYRGEPVS